VKERDGNHYKRDPRDYFIAKYGCDPKAFLPDLPDKSFLAHYLDVPSMKEEQLAREHMAALRRFATRLKYDFERLLSRPGKVGTPADLMNIDAWAPLPLPFALRGLRQAIDVLSGSVAEQPRKRARLPEHALAQAACRADRWIRDARLKRDPRWLGSTSGHGYQRPADRHRTESDQKLACWPDVVRLLELFGFVLSHIGGDRAQAIRKLVERHRAREPLAYCHIRAVSRPK
jgi:hypothetical protein